MGPGSLFQRPFANVSFRRYILLIWEQKDAWATLEKQMNQNMSVTTVLYAKKQSLNSAEKSPKSSPFPWQDNRLLAPICCMWIKKFTWLSVITSQRTGHWEATSWHRRRLILQTKNIFARQHDVEVVMSYDGHHYASEEFKTFSES